MAQLDPITLGDFSRQAEVYARARPGYPDELVRRLVGHAGVAPTDPVADIGAGTGLFTQLLAGQNLTVTAIDPNAAMRAFALRLPATTWRDGSFESTGLDDGSQVWVTAAQAFHWADPPKALPELHRILRPDGHLTVLWNNRLNE